MRLIALGALTALAFSVAPDARADTLRCGSKLIEVGVTKGEVLAKCGEPDYAEDIDEPVRARSANGGTYVVGTATRTIWTYKRRPGKFPAVLTFDGSVLKSIEFIKS